MEIELVAVVGGEGIESGRRMTESARGHMVGAEGEKFVSQFEDWRKRPGKKSAPVTIGGGDPDDIAEADAKRTKVGAVGLPCRLTRHGAAVGKRAWKSGACDVSAWGSVVDIAKSEAAIEIRSEGNVFVATRNPEVVGPLDQNRVARGAVANPMASCASVEVVRPWPRPERFTEPIGLPWAWNQKPGFPFASLEDEHFQEDGMLGEECVFKVRGEDERCSNEVKRRSGGSVAFE